MPAHVWQCRSAPRRPRNRRQSQSAPVDVRGCALRHRSELEHGAQALSAGPSPDLESTAGWIPRDGSRMSFRVSSSPEATSLNTSLSPAGTAQDRSRVWRLWPRASRPRCLLVSGSDRRRAARSMRCPAIVLQIGKTGTGSGRYSRLPTSGRTTTRLTCGRSKQTTMCWCRLHRFRAARARRRCRTSCAYRATCCAIRLVKG